MSRPESAAAHQAEKTSKSERLEARLSREQKELLQWAADLEGRSLTDFVVSHAQNAAVQTISECRDRNRLRSETKSIFHSCNRYTRTVSENTALI